MSTPTLIIGLGGTGLTIVKKIVELASEKQRKNLGFVVFDTDVNELRSVEDAKLGIHTIQISDSLTVGEYLQQDSNARENWFPVNQVLNSKLMTDGAGQVRAVSRLSFNTALVQGKMAPLDEAISELYRLKGEKLDQAPRIIITGSLCGGTGSGLSLPVALYTRNYLETRAQQGTCIVRGFFLLPEVFFDVIRGNSERDNLRANAYAALREIDAFIMKADGNLPKEYDLHFTIPRVNAREEDEYTGRPMDFCFLFDGQNMKGQSLGSFDEYLTHAANCIYGMAIAPTSRRSNSSEDNVIRDIMAEKGRNRYAGAGTSMLIYPVKDVKRYLALCWTEEIVSNEWVKNDRAFKYQMESNRMRRNEGAPVIPLDRGKEYIDAIVTGKNQNDPFSREIWRHCTVFEDDAEKIEKQSKAESYAESLYAFIANEKRRYRDEQADIEKKLEDHQTEVVGKSGANLQKELTSWAKDLAAWRTIAEDATAHCGEVLSFTLFKDPADFTTRKEEDYRIEHWLFSKGKFIHPNAVRYFAYETVTRLEEAKVGAEARYQEIVKEYNTSFQDLFDLEETEKKESAAEYIQANKLNRNINIFNRSKFRGSVEEVSGRMLSLKSVIDELWDCNAERIILANAVEYLKALSKSYETFFDAVDRYCVVMHDEIEHLENKYQMQDGKAVRYVCADKECLRALGAELVNKSNTMDLPSELNRRIYTELRKFALQNIKDSRKGAEKEKDQKANLITANRFCISVFNETIVEHMAQEIEDEYDTRVNMDVLSALEQEAVYRRNGEEMTSEVRSAYINNYMKDAIERTELLASPFIESPRDRQNRTIETCTYSSNLVSSDLPVSGRLDFVRQNLPNGVVSDDIDPTMILFYQAVYAIEAADLGKFAPARITSTTNKPAGDYYKAYHSLISKLHPDTQASRKITPHIDRWWHLVTKTPELSEQAQRQQKKDIMRALVWSLLGRYVNFFAEAGSERRYYKRSGAKITIENETDTRLIVSNGTPCDRLYELQDALTIYPELVYTILEDVDAQIKMDSDDGYNMAIEDTVLYQCLSEFRVKEFPLKKTVTKEDGKEGTVKNAVRSIFELPLLLKRSVPASQYNANDMMLLIDTIIEELYNFHVTMFEKDDPDDMIKTYDSLLLNQFRLMQENISIEAQAAREDAEKKGVTLNGDIEKDVLNYDLLERLVKEISVHGYVKDTREIKKVLNKQDDE